MFIILIHIATADKTKDKRKEISKVTVTAFMLTVIVGIVGWKLLSTYHFFIMFTTLFAALITMLIFQPNTVKITASNIITDINSVVKRATSTVVTMINHIKPSYVAAVIMIVMWVASSVFVGTKLIVAGLCLGGIIVVYYIKPYNSHLTIKEIYREIYPLLAAWSGTTVFVTIMLLTIGCNWEIITFIISILAVMFCLTLFLIVFILLVV